MLDKLSMQVAQPIRQAAEDPDYLPFCVMIALNKPRGIMVPLEIALVEESGKSIRRPRLHHKIKDMRVVIYLIRVQKLNNIRMIAYFKHAQLFANCVLTTRGIYPTELLDGNDCARIGIFRLVNNAETSTTCSNSCNLFIWDIASRLIGLEVEGIRDFSQAFRPICGQESEALSATVK